ncbi:unnamed protein product, partial [Polarella glacialis]
AGRGGGGQGKGRGRGGADARAPAGAPSGGLVRRPEKQKPGRGGKGGGRGGKSQAAAGKGGRRNGAGPMPDAEVVEVVREDGMFRHSEIIRAHSDAVMSVVMSSDCIYTASRDKLLKRWKVSKDASGKFQLLPELEVPLGDVCWCLISAGDWLLCGMGDGSIKGFQQTGKEALLKGHSKRVCCLLTHLHVLLSGSLDGSVRCWQMDANTQTFACTHSITEGISGAVQCLAVLGERLWVGGTSGIAVVELGTLQVSAQIPPKKFVAGLLQFEGHMIVVYADGSVSIFDAEGVLKHNQPALPAGPVLCVAGLECGPRLLCGHAKGQ